MCRSADDCGLVLGVIAGRDPLDRTTSSRTLTYPEPAGKKERFRIGVIRDATQGCQPAVRENFEVSLKVLEKFCRITDGVLLPDLPFGPVVGTIVNAEGASALRDLLENGKARELRDANLKWAGYAASMTLAVDYLQAMRVRLKMKKALDEIYARYDALVAPARSTVAYPINVDFDKAYLQFRGGPPIIPAGNIAGQPALSVPNGFGPNNLPTGIQFTGRAWSEARLIAMAHAYQQATDWHTRRPAEI
jgi:aspartyl-tRNA(Asn)/glutamyl-tRNA(Gln) amidotransferase subunit A